MFISYTHITFIHTLVNELRVRLALVFLSNNTRKSNNEKQCSLLFKKITYSHLLLFVGILFIFNSIVENLFYIFMMIIFLTHCIALSRPSYINNVKENNEKGATGKIYIHIFFLCPTSCVFLRRFY